jgi:endonuclease/exonuclease/phosphatase family metal-dependent hydrolase
MAMLTLVLCILLITSAFSDYINPTFWVFPSFLGIAFGVFLFLAVVWFFVLLVTQRWHSLLMLVITLAIISMPALRYCPLHFGGGPEPLTLTEKGEEIDVDSLRVFSFNTNIMGQTHLSRIKEHIPVIDVIRKSKADIVCLQEYGFTLKQGGHTEQELRNELKDLYPFYDYTPNDGRKALGIAIYSKYPIRKATPVDKRKKGYFSAMYYQLDIKGHKVGLVNMHLRSNMIDPKDRILYDEMIEKFEADSLTRIRTGMVRSLAQAYRLRSAESSMLRQLLIDQHPSDMPLLVCGDMNDTPISYCYESLRQVGLKDTWQETGLGTGITYRAHHLWFRIDYMLHNKHLRALHMKVRRDVKLSDHYPIEATFQLLPE